MKKHMLLLLLFTTLSQLNFACINEEEIPGEVIQSIQKQRSIPYGRRFDAQKKENEEKLIRLEKAWKQKQDYKAYNDYGVTLIYLGRFEEALKVFQLIEKQKPGKYSTAANMGTTYEVLGKNDSALYWIKRGVAINPASHDSSEWLHVKILEAKIKNDPNLTSTFFTGVDFGTEAVPQSKLPLKQLEALRDALYYQLNERVSFIKPKDRIVSLLLVELGNVTAITNDAQTAYENYNLAYEYGYSGALFKQRITTMKRAATTGDVDMGAKVDTAINPNRQVKGFTNIDKQFGKGFLGTKMILLLIAGLAGLLILAMVLPWRNKQK